MTVATQELLRLDGLGRRFGGLRALRDVDLEVRDGEIMGLIGPNGAGKTTLVSVVSGQIAASEGTVRFGGEDVTGLSAHRRARAGIGRTFQNVRLFAEESVLDNVKTGAYLLGHSGVADAILRLPRQRRDEREIGEAALDALELVGLAHRALAPAAELSTGEQRLAELAKAAAMRPRLLFLDEPAAGLNPTEEARLSETITTLATRMTLVVIEHHLDLVMSLCDRVAVLDFGRLICVGTPDEVRADPNVIAAYLGPDPAREE
jgi:branched-chain amino acid transport system ATP-binding protein